MEEDAAPDAASSDGEDAADSVQPIGDYSTDDLTATIRKVFSDSPEQFDPREYLGPGREAMMEVCKKRMIAFGQAGWAGKVPLTTCKKMVDFYVRK